MQVTGLTAEQIQHAVMLASGARFGGNITWKNVRDDKPTRDGRPRATFTLRGFAAGGPGTRDNQPALDGTPGRKTISACWHAHDAVMRIIFAANRAAVVKTGLRGPFDDGTGKTKTMAPYAGAEDYRIRGENTAWLNTGSEVHPYYYNEGCDCIE